MIILQAHGKNIFTLCFLLNKTESLLEVLFLFSPCWLIIIITIGYFLYPYYSLPFSHSYFMYNVCQFCDFQRKGWVVEGKNPAVFPLPTTTWAKLVYL